MATARLSGPEMTAAFIPRAGARRQAGLPAATRPRPSRPGELLRCGTMARSSLTAAANCAHASMNAPLPIDRISAEAEAAGAAPRLRAIP